MSKARKLMKLVESVVSSYDGSMDVYVYATYEENVNAKTSSGKSYEGIVFSVNTRDAFNTVLKIMKGLCQYEKHLVVRCSPIIVSNKTKGLFHAAFVLDNDSSGSYSFTDSDFDDATADRLINLQHKLAKGLKSLGYRVLYL